MSDFDKWLKKYYEEQRTKDENKKNWIKYEKDMKRYNRILLRQDIGSIFSEAPKEPKYLFKETK